MTPFAPASSIIDALTSPVKAPASANATFWANTQTLSTSRKALESVSK
jgi:hypothetical protein